METEVPDPDRSVRTEIARAFAHARREAVPLRRYPGSAPTDLEAAYGIQDQALALDGRVLAGWKVGRIPEPDAARLGANRLAGPIFADTLVEESGGLESELPAFTGGFIAVEAEFLLRLRVPEHATLPEDGAAAQAWVDDVRMGIEIASSPYVGINDDGACVTVSDFGNNAGVLIGAAVPGWRGRDLRTIEVTTEVAGRSVGQGTVATMLDGPFGAVRFLLHHLRWRGIEPRSGWWVSSGAITGVHLARIGERAVVTFGGIESLACRIVPARPRA